jgi:hypothetical protein
VLRGWSASVSRFWVFWIRNTMPGLQF